MSKEEYLNNLINLKDKLKEMGSINEYFYEIVLNILQRQNEILLKFFEEKENILCQYSLNEDILKKRKNLMIEQSNPDEILVIYLNCNVLFHWKKYFDASFKRLEKKDLTLRL